MPDIVPYNGMKSILQKYSHSDSKNTQTKLLRRMEGYFEILIPQVSLILSGGMKVLEGVEI